jgi:hypothetical protein
MVGVVGQTQVKEDCGIGLASPAAPSTEARSFLGPRPLQHLQLAHWSHGSHRFLAHRVPQRPLAPPCLRGARASCDSGTGRSPLPT